MLNRKQAPPIKNAVDFQLKLKPCQHFTLNNGVELYCLDAGQEDVVQLEWVFWAGNSHETKNLVSGATNHLLKNGTTKHSAYEINEHFEFFGSFLNRSSHHETANISLHALSRHLPELLPMVRELITEAIFPEKELALFVQNSKQKLSVNLMKGDFVANREIDVLLYGKDHPYGKYSRHEDYDALNREDLVAFYQQHYPQGRCVIFVAGKLPANIFSLLNQFFGDLPLKKHEISVPALPPFAKVENRGSRILNDPNGVQGAIRLGAHFHNRHHPHFKEVQVLNTLFGGYFGSRLMSNIREDKGFTYGIHSYLQSHFGPGAWIISTEAGREVCDATLHEIYVEMERLRNEPVGEEELMLVRNFLLGSLLGDLDGPFHIIGRWKSYVLNGLTEDYFYQATETIRRISPQRIQELANQYLVPDHFYELVVV